MAAHERVIAAAARDAVFARTAEDEEGVICAAEGEVVGSVAAVHPDPIHAASRELALHAVQPHPEEGLAAPDGDVVVVRRSADHQRAVDDLGRGR
jgi:hypothetical protein